MLIRELPSSQRPDVRIRDLGAAAVSTVELLTIVTGNRDSKPAEALLSLAGGSLRRLASFGSDRIIGPKGMGKKKVALLQACFELGRRMCAETREEATPVRSPKDVVAFCAPRLEDMPVEEFHVLVLDAQHRLERDVTVTRGILNSSLVHPREVFREAIAERAAAIILVHNHPSGDPTPSADDRNVTDQLVAAGRLLDIPVHDHVIIGRGRYTSFAEAGLL
jgi:DNA repair protein RadC